MTKFVTSSEDVTFINREEDLLDILPALKKSKAIGMDLESNSLYRYHHHICLMQISTVDDIFIVDTTTTGIPDEFLSFLQDESTVKIFQDMQYDVALFYHHFELIPSSLFDISQADRLIRMNNQLHSLDKLVDDYLDAEFPEIKGAQKTNWGERPLSENQIIYAANDVVPLIPIRHHQINQISDFHRVCFEEYMKNYEPSTLEKQFNPLSMWKIKGISESTQQTRRILYHLLLARDHVASYLDRPFFWISRDRDLFRIATSPPDSPEEMEQRLLQNTSDWLARSAARPLYNAVKKGMAEKKEYHRPESGISLKRWVEIDSESANTGYHPHNIAVIKDWMAEVSKNLKLPKDYLVTKGEIASLSIQDAEEISNGISLNGIPPSMRNVFREDLFQYFDSAKSRLNPDMMQTGN